MRPSTASCVLSLVMHTCSATSSGTSFSEWRYATRSMNGLNVIIPFIDRVAYRHFLQRVAIRHPVDERDDDVQPRLEHLVEFAEPLDDPGALLRHHAHAFDHEHHHQRDDGERDPKRTERLVTVDEYRGDDDGDYLEKHAASR